jgi:hypothetical protein
MAVVGRKEHDRAKSKAGSRLDPLFTKFRTPHTAPFVPPLALLLHRAHMNCR